MLSTDQSLELGLPAICYGSVWLVGAADCGSRHLSPLAVHALRTADAVVHDPGIAQEILDLVQPPRYREVASPAQAIERVIKLAEDGWRVVQLVEGDAMQRAVESATRCAKRNVPFRVVPNAGEPLGCEAPLGLLMVRQPISVGDADPRPTLVLLVAAPHSDSAAGMAPRQRPLDFSMSGLAG
jgi:uroporphyrin-III C-methyltransferase